MGARHLLRCKRGGPLGPGCGRAATGSVDGAGQYPRCPSTSVSSRDQLALTGGPVGVQLGSSPSVWAISLSCAMSWCRCAWLAAVPSSASSGGIRSLAWRTTLRPVRVSRRWKAVCPRRRGDARATRPPRAHRSARPCCCAGSRARLPAAAGSVMRALPAHRGRLLRACFQPGGREQLERPLVARSGVQLAPRCCHVASHHGR